MKKAVQVTFAAMDEPSRPEDGYTNPGCNQLVVPKEAAILTALDNLRYLEEKDSHEKASTFNFDGSAGAREAISSTRNRCDYICSSVHSHGHQFSPSVEDSRCFNTLDISRNLSDPYRTAVNYFDPSHYWNNSASNYIFNNENYPDDAKYKPEIWSTSAEDLSSESTQDSHYNENLKLNASSITFPNRAVAGIDGQQIESRFDLSQISQNNSEPCPIPDLVESNSSYSSVKNFAASGSAGSHRNENTEPVVSMMVQSSNTGDITSIKYEEIKALVCKTCVVQFSEKETEEIFLSSVDSLHYNFERPNLLFHRSTHVPKTTCNICGKEHAVENSHKREHICPDPDCKKTFPCRTLFYQHIPEHGKYFKKHCWVCRRKFREHITDQDSMHICCVCGARSNLLGNFEKHNRLHLPRCFCILCKKEYHVDEKKYHGKEIKCCVCNCTFKCQIQLEEHIEDHVKNYSDFCEVSESNEKNPSCRWTFQGDFQFHSELDLKNRLYSISGLNYFKCDQCDRRFSTIPGFNAHHQFCKALPYKCEICETRFFTIDLLHSHGLVKHADRIE